MWQKKLQRQKQNFGKNSWDWNEGKNKTAFFSSDTRNDNAEAKEVQGVGQQPANESQA